MPRLTSVEIRTVLYRIADDACTHPDDIGNRAMQVARALAESAPDGDFHSDFVRAARQYALIVAGHRAFHRASMCFDYARHSSVCAGLDGVKHRIADRDGATAQAERELARTWNRLFDVPQQPAADCCPITGDEYGTAS